MEKIIYGLYTDLIYHLQPGYHYLSYKNNIYDINISHYMQVQIVYEHFNQVRYTRLELDTKNQSCSSFQFYAGYREGGNDKQKINQR